jgi:hypothetical protein
MKQVPALFTSASSPPHCASIRTKAAATAAGSVRSAGQGRKDSPCRRAMVPSPSASRSSPATSRPSASNRAVMACPMPPAAPVTAAMRCSIGPRYLVAPIKERRFPSLKGAKGNVTPPFARSLAPLSREPTHGAPRLDLKPASSRSSPKPVRWLNLVSGFVSAATPGLSEGLPSSGERKRTRCLPNRTPRG